MAHALQVDIGHLFDRRNATADPCEPALGPSPAQSVCEQPPGLNDNVVGGQPTWVVRHDVLGSIVVLVAG